MFTQFAGHKNLFEATTSCQSLPPQSPREVVVATPALHALCCCHAGFSPESMTENMGKRVGKHEQL